MKTLILLITGLCFSISSYAQNIPDASQLEAGRAANTEDVTALIDELLGVGSGSGDIMGGIKDLGIDFMYLAQEKALDEVFKAIAQGTVYALPATKIMALRQKLKDNSLSRQLQKLEAVWKHGQEKMNKINYQKYKVGYRKSKEMNAPGTAIIERISNTVIDSDLESFWGDRVSVVSLIDGSTAADNVALKKKYLGNDWDWNHVVIPLNEVQEDASLKALNQVIKRQGKSVYTTPYERMQLQKQLRTEVSRRKSKVGQIRTKTNAVFDELRLKELRQKESHYWLNRNR